MYTSPAANVGATTGILAITGIQFGWFFIAAVALIGAGFAIMRFVPKKEN